MWKTLQRWVALVLVTGVLTVAGCSTQSASQPSSASPSPSQSAAPATQTGQPTGVPRLNGKATVSMAVKGAVVTLELDGTNAPVTAGNFVDLVQRGVYDGLVFHRVVREPEPFVVQGGDPQSKNPNVPMEQLGTGSYVDPDTKQARYLPLEIKPEGAEIPVYHQTLGDAGVSAKPKLKHTRGAVAMPDRLFLILHPRSSMSLWRMLGSWTAAMRYLAM